MLSCECKTIKFLDRITREFIFLDFSIGESHLKRLLVLPRPESPLAALGSPRSTKSEEYLERVHIPKINPKRMGSVPAEENMKHYLDDFCEILV